MAGGFQGLIDLHEVVKIGDLYGMRDGCSLLQVVQLRGNCLRGARTMHCAVDAYMVKPDTEEFH